MLAEAWLACVCTCRYDVDGSGELDEDELVNVLGVAGFTEEEAHAIFKEVDVDKGGSVSMDEFETWCAFFSCGALAFSVRLGWPAAEAVPHVLWCFVACFWCRWIVSQRQQVRYGQPRPVFVSLGPARVQVGGSVVARCIHHRHARRGCSPPPAPPPPPCDAEHAAQRKVRADARGARHQLDGHDPAAGAPGPLEPRALLPRAAAAAGAGRRPVAHQQGPHAPAAHGHPGGVEGGGRGARVEDLGQALRRGGPNGV